MSRENVLRVDFVLIWVIVTDNNDALNKIYRVYVNLCRQVSRLNWANKARNYVRMSTKGPGKLTWSAVLNLVSYRPNLVPGWGLFHYLRNRPRSTGELHFHILEYFGEKKSKYMNYLVFFCYCSHTIITGWALCPKGQILKQLPLVLWWLT